MDIAEVQRIDMTLRKCVQSLCAPIWWESASQAVVRSGTMCVVQTPEALVGITNNHVLETYERHKAEKHDIFCQLLVSEDVGCLFLVISRRYRLRPLAWLHPLAWLRPLAWLHPLA